MDRKQLIDSLDIQAKKEAYEAMWVNFGHAPDWFWLDLVHLLAQSEGRVQASLCWLLKRKMTLGASDELVIELLNLDFSEIAEMPRLDLIQGLCQHHLDDISVHLLEPIIEGSIASNKPFLRAWTISLLCFAAENHEPWVERAQHLVSQSTGDPKASIRARMRHLQQRFTFLNS